MMERLRPRADFHTQRGRIVPREDYIPTSLHTRTLPPGSAVSSVDAEWCPVCLGRQISERVADGKVVWHCSSCGNEW